jgi:phosphate-selective porin OprO/OprP
VIHGGDLVQTWLVTGEVRPYNMVNGSFKAVSPAKSVFAGGPGAWEVVMRESYIDENDGGVQGGKFWRLTPMVNWYMSDQLRLETAYGYSALDRFGTVGHTHFFQMRLQIWI